MKTLIVLGADKIAGLALSRIEPFQEGSKIIIDRSTSITRLGKLLRSKTLSPVLAGKMAFCEVGRSNKKPRNDLEGITCNLELLQAIKDFDPGRLVLFRAGLIINKAVLSTGIPVLNIHAASVPDFGGIGSINRALRAKSYKQSACLHVITSRIDEGLVLDKEDYTLDPKLCYCANEDIAYKAAVNLLQRALQKEYVF